MFSPFQMTFSVEAFCAFLVPWSARQMVRITEDRSKLAGYITAVEWKLQSMIRFEGRENLKPNVLRDIDLVTFRMRRLKGMVSQPPRKIVL